MKKSLKVLALFLLLSSIISAQKIKNEKITYPYIALAKSPIQANFTTYSVKILSHGYAIDKYGWTKQELVDKYFSLERYEYVQSKGDLEMTIKLGAAPAKHRKLVKSEDGDYEGVIGYTLPIKLIFKDGKRELIAEHILNPGTEMKTVEVKNYGKDYKKAKARWEAQSNEFAVELLTKNYLKEFEQVRMALASIDNRMDHDSRPLFYIKNADDYNMDFSKDAAKEIKKSLKDITKNQNSVAAKSTASSLLKSMQPYLEHNTNEVAFVAKFNSALAHVILKEYDQAQAFLQACNDSGIESKHVLNLIKEIDDRLERINVNNIDQDQYVATYDGTGVVEGEIASSSGEIIELRDYVIDAEGNKINGILRYSGILGGVIEKVDIDTRKEGEGRMISLKAEEISEIGYDGSEYLMHRFKDSDGFRVRNYCLLKVYQNENVTLLKSLTKDLKSKNANHSPFYILENDKIHILKAFNVLNFNKGVSKKLKSCPLVEQNAKSKMYDRTDVAKLKQLVDDLASCK